MNELQETIRKICKDMADISALLAARSRELDRRESFDEEFKNEIYELKRRYNEYRHTRPEPNDSRLCAGRLHAGCQGL